MALHGVIPARNLRLVITPGCVLVEASGAHPHRERMIKSLFIDGSVTAPVMSGQWHDGGSLYFLLDLHDESLRFPRACRSNAVDAHGKNA